MIREPESSALATAIPVGARLVTSALAVVEVSRAVRHAAAESDVEMPLEELLDGCAIVDVERDVLRVAASISPSELRSYDAIHLATALTVMPDAMIVYDRRLGRAAMDAGLRVIAPGAVP